MFRTILCAILVSCVHHVGATQASSPVKSGPILAETREVLMEQARLLSVIHLEHSTNLKKNCSRLLSEEEKLNLRAAMLLFKTKDEKPTKANKPLRDKIEHVVRNSVRIQELIENVFCRIII